MPKAEFPILKVRRDVGHIYVGPIQIISMHYPGLNIEIKQEDILRISRDVAQARAKAAKKKAASKKRKASPKN